MFKVAANVKAFCRATVLFFSAHHKSLKELLMLKVYTFA